MKKKKALLFFLTPPVVAAILYFILKPSQERLVLDKIELLRSFFNYNQEEFKTYEALIASKDFAENFAESLAVTLHLENQSKEYKRTKKELANDYLSLKKNLCEISLELVNFKIKIEKDRASAAVDAKLLGRDCGRTDYFQEIHPIRIDLVKINRLWLVSGGENLDKINY